MIDTGWISDFLDDVFERWLQSAGSPDGLFHPYLDRQWHHHKDGPRTLVSQCRLIYNFACAYERGGDERFAYAARCGIMALIRYFHEIEGAWRWSVNADGSQREDNWDAYGHAFVVYALAHAARIFDNELDQPLAIATWKFMQRCFGEENGGLIWHVTKDGKPAKNTRSQNPIMHIFEALLALAPLDKSGAIAEDAANICRFILALRLDSGALPEWYDDKWQPLESGERFGVDIGHQFEWAFLLSEAHGLNLGTDLLDVGREFLALGIKWGYDSQQGGIFDEATLDGALRKRSKGWWQQCEAIRALHRYAMRHGEEEFAEPLQRSLDFARRHFVDAEFGGWYSNPPGMGGETNLDKGNPYKLDYHVVNMCLEMLD